MRVVVPVTDGVPVVPDDGGVVPVEEVPADVLTGVPDEEPLGAGVLPDVAVVNGELLVPAVAPVRSTRNVSIREVHPKAVSEPSVPSQ
jgi:hypothetical protein